MEDKNIFHFSTFLEKLNVDLVVILLLMAMLTVVPRAQATVIPPGYMGLKYDVTLADGINGVTQINFINQQSDGNLAGWGWPYFFSPRTSSVTQLWPTFAPFKPVAATIGIGIVTNIPNDPVGVTISHLAVIGNFQTNQIGMEFSTLFPHVTESELIDHIIKQDFQLFRSKDPSETDSLMNLFNDAKNLGLFISPGGNFNVVAFTQGQLIGTGTFDIVGAPSPAPEPATFALMGLGLLSVITARRRKQNLAE